MKVTHANVLKLSLEQRIAWATAVAEKVIHLFSAHFRKRYLQSVGIDAAWAIATGRPKAIANADKVADQIGAKIEVADQAGYGFTCVSPIIEVLMEAVEPDAKGKRSNLVAAIEDSAAAYAYLALFKQGVCAGDPAVPLDYIEQQGAPVWKLAEQMLSIAQQTPEVAAARKRYDALSFELIFEPLTPAVLRRKRKDLNPPAKEVPRTIPAAVTSRRQIGGVRHASDTTTQLLQKWVDGAPQRAKKLARELRKAGFDEEFIQENGRELKIVEPKALPLELPTFDPKVKRALTPMLKSRFRFAGTINNGSERWLGPEDMQKAMLTTKILRHFKSHKKHWEGSAPMTVSESRLSLLAFFGDAPSDQTYLVWPDSGKKEPAVYRYFGHTEQVFKDLNAFLAWAIG